MISDQALKEFKAIWQEECGELPPDDILLDEAINLLTMMNHTYRPVKNDWVNKNKDENNKRNVRRLQGTNDPIDLQVCRNRTFPKKQND